jgi:F0F1-type ATP synthase delta subunit
VWNKKIDKEILGGVILKFQDTILDLSMAGRIEALAEEIKK